MKCLIKNLEVNYPCSRVCPLYGDCVTAFLEERKQQVRTNADRIRAMSNEELAEIFTRYAYEAHGKWYGPDQKTYWSESKYALKAWLDWIRQPAEED